MDTYRTYMPRCACVREVGRHRSVAACHILTELLAADMPVTEEHWCLGGRYRPPCGCPDACQVLSYTMFMHHCIVVYREHLRTCTYKQ